MNQCKAMVYKRDTYRLVRGRGFKMHYSMEQCKRKTKDEYCWQHLKEEQPHDN